MLGIARLLPMLGPKQPVRGGVTRVRIFVLLGFALSSALISAQAVAERPIPYLSGPIVDEASLLDPASRNRLDALVRAARSESEGQGPQLQFLLVPTLGGEPIADYSIRVVEEWKIGSRGKDNGVLFVVVRDDRRVRIEVGAGLEGELTDAQAGRIIRNTIAPAFREGRYGDGLFQAAIQVLTILDALPQGFSPPDGAGQPARGRPAEDVRSVATTIGLFVIILVLAALSRRRRTGGPFGPFWFGGFRGHDGLGGFRGGARNVGQRGGGGGGFSGGGGGFSGGGASGGW